MLRTRSWYRLTACRWRSAPVSPRNGLTSLTQGASRVFEGGAVVQTVVEMQRGVLVIMAISNGSSLAVLAASTCDLGLVAYEMTLLVERAGRVLTPATRGVMQAAIPGDGRR